MNFLQLTSVLDTGILNFKQLRNNNSTEVSNSSLAILMSLTQTFLIRCTICQRYTCSISLKEIILSQSTQSRYFSLQFLKSLFKLPLTFSGFCYFLYFFFTIETNLIYIKLYVQVHEVLFVSQCNLFSLIKDIFYDRIFFFNCIYYICLLNTIDTRIYIQQYIFFYLSAEYIYLSISSIHSTFPYFSVHSILNMLYPCLPLSFV